MIEYGLSVIVSLAVFTVLDIIILSNSLRNGASTERKKAFSVFAVSVTLQQGFALLAQLSDPQFNLLGNGFTYFSYIGALIFMTASAYSCYRYLRMMISGEKKISSALHIVYALPLLVIIATSLLSPLTHWVFYIDAGGAYQRGSIFFLQMFCPYVYFVLLIILCISERNNEDSGVARQIRHFSFIFMVPSMIGVIIQFFVVRGGYSSVGISVGLVLLYLEIYVEDIGENRRLKSIENLNVRLQEINEEQKAHIGEIAALNMQLQNNQSQLEQAAEEQKTQLQEISELNRMLEERMSVIQSMSRVYFVSFYADLINGTFSEISNTDFVRKYVGTDGDATQALEIFCNMMVHPEFKETLYSFVDLSTINERMKNKEFITCDYLGNVAGWCQLYFIAGNRNEDGSLQTIFLAARTIHDEKEREIAQNRELDNARIQAEAANAAKTVFLNNMSHDIRTPLNAILGFSDLMAKEKDKPEIVDKYLKKIKTSGEYLLSIVNDVLDMARIESGRVTMEYSVVDIDAEKESSCSYIKDFVEASNHRFISEVSYTHKYVKIDIPKYQQVMMNLLSNAVKYTPEKGSITLKVEELLSERPGYARFRMTVSDTGIGMTQEFLKHIFDSFSRERNTTESKIMGTGLGMSIVKRLVDLAGGTIEVESEKDHGTTFTVTCDLEIAEVSENPSGDAEADILKGRSLEGKRVLLTEDNELNAEIATAVLEDAGLLVEHAENGLICIEMLSTAPKDHFDLILMDIQMPFINGYETTKRIREMGMNLPIIAMTANAFEEDKRNAYAAGMNGHLSKPINISKVMETLATVLK